MTTQLLGQVPFPQTAEAIGGGVNESGGVGHLGRLHPIACLALFAGAVCDGALKGQQLGQPWLVGVAVAKLLYRRVRHTSLNGKLQHLRPLHGAKLRAELLKVDLEVHAPILSTFGQSASSLLPTYG